MRKFSLFWDSVLPLTSMIRLEQCVSSRIAWLSNKKCKQSCSRHFDWPPRVNLTTWHVAHVTGKSSDLSRSEVEVLIEGMSEAWKVYNFSWNRQVWNVTVCLVDTVLWSVATYIRKVNIFFTENQLPWQVDWKMHRKGPSSMKQGCKYKQVV